MHLQNLQTLECRQNFRLHYNLKKLNALEEFGKNTSVA